MWQLAINFFYKNDISIKYGNISRGVFKIGIQNYKGFCQKINCSLMKSLNLENWCNGDFQSQFSTSKIIQIFLNFIFIEEYECRSKFFCYWHFLITPIFKSLYFLKWRLIFDSLPLLKFSQVNNLIWIAKIFLILYPSLENSTTGIAIVYSH